MAQKLADFTCTVELIGLKDSIEKVYKDLINPARNKVSQRTLLPTTIYSEATLGEGRNEKGTRKAKYTFTATRKAVKGNWRSDITRHINRSVVRTNVDVIIKVFDEQRTEI